MDNTNVDSLYRSYASVAQKLNIPSCEEDQTDMKQVVRCCMAEVRKLLLPWYTLCCRKPLYKTLFPDMAQSHQLDSSTQRTCRAGKSTSHTHVYSMIYARGEWMRRQ